MSYNSVMKASDAVREFHAAFNIPKVHPTNIEAVKLRLRLIREEYLEVLKAAGWTEWEDGNCQTYLSRIGEMDSLNLLKELADLAYVVYGTAEAFGWDLDEAVKRVHESNMTKLGEDGKPIYREDGKVLKGQNYKEPYLGDLV